MIKQVIGDPSEVSSEPGPSDSDVRSLSPADPTNKLEQNTNSTETPNKETPNWSKNDYMDK